MRRGYSPESQSSQSLIPPPESAQASLDQKKLVEGDGDEKAIPDAPETEQRSTATQESPALEQASLDTVISAYQTANPERITRIAAARRENARLHREEEPIVGATEQEMHAVDFFEEESRIEAETGKDLLTRLPQDRKDELFIMAREDREEEPEIPLTANDLEDAARLARRAMESMATPEGPYLHAGKPVETREDVEILFKDLVVPRPDTHVATETFEKLPTWLQYTLKALEAEQERAERIYNYTPSIKGTSPAKMRSQREGDERIMSPIALDIRRGGSIERVPLPLIDPTGETLRIALQRQAVTDWRKEHRQVRRQEVDDLYAALAAEKKLAADDLPDQMIGQEIEEPYALAPNALIPAPRRQEEAKPKPVSETAEKPQPPTAAQPAEKPAIKREGTRTYKLADFLQDNDSSPDILTSAPEAKPEKGAKLVPELADEKDEKPAPAKTTNPGHGIYQEQRIKRMDL